MNIKKLLLIFYFLDGGCFGLTSLIRSPSLSLDQEPLFDLVQPPSPPEAASHGHPVHWGRHHFVSSVPGNRF